MQHFARGMPTVMTCESTPRIYPFDLGLGRNATKESGLWQGGSAATSQQDCETAKDGCGHASHFRFVVYAERDEIAVHKRFAIL